MHCPYCQAPVSEESPACPRCGVDLDKATAFFGVPPPLVQGVNDSAGVIRATDTRDIRAMPTFHPAYLLRSPSYKRMGWLDLRAIAKALDEAKPQSS